jgi:hypothetical protein
MQSSGRIIKKKKIPNRDRIWNNGWEKRGSIRKDLSPIWALETNKYVQEKEC